ncbi:hypothetical protein IWW34DRAFT_641190 [Fusarium oxysporum f. sp. albedinis]|nr:hypothetical protein IWW34DRAFT_641190 [Fusarium oxysporum f. sp. albedinis]KAJ0133978.1 Uncharacterized protein HZ326_22967 [Fusarium oxysporum f. sp. albedinis]
MDLLPPKVYWMLIDYLSVSDLHSLVSCSRSIHKKAKPMLYRVLRLDFDNGNIRPQTLLLLRTLMHNPELMKFVRSVEFLNTGSSIWTQGHSQLLSLILVRMNLRPERVTAFSTTSSWVPLNTYFGGLNSLTYAGAVSATQLEWLRWHLSNCKQISHLHIRLSKRGSNYHLPLLRTAGLDCLSELCLENCTVEHFVPEESWRLRWLDLRYCSGTETFMHRLLSGHQLQLLKVLRLSGRLSRRTFLSLLVSLEENRRLEELSLRLESLPQLVGQEGYGRSLAPSKLGDSCQRLRSRILGHLETHGPRLRSATIDIRQDIDFCMPSMLFTVQDIARIIKSCPSVEFLGLPIDFHDLFSNQARSINYPVKLQALHLRGEYGAFSEMAKNTTTLVNLIQAPPTFQIFVGYGKMLKTIHIPSSGYPLYSRVTKSQKTNYCLDL